MNAQRRVTAPPEIQAEVVTDSLRVDRPGTPTGTDNFAVPVTPHKEFRWIPPYGSRAFAQAFSPSDLVLPSTPGVG